MNSISQYARAYAAALDRLEAVRSFLKMDWPKEQKVNVTWSHGSSVPGYKELSEEVSKLVSERMPDLIDQALANTHSAVARAHGQLNDAAFLGSKGHLRAGDVSNAE